MSVDASAPLMRPLDAAIAGTKNAAKLTHRLLAFSRQQALDPVNLDLNKLIARLSDSGANLVARHRRNRLVRRLVADIRRCQSNGERPSQSRDQCQGCHA